MLVTEYEFEPVRGLPGPLPAGERILWQGAPDWRVFARTALFTRWVALYFGALAVIALMNGSMYGAVATLISGVILLGLLALFAYGVGRTTVYTITNRRVVLRIGVALNKCINLPLKMIASAQMRDHGRECGDIALDLTGRHRLGYAVLWPHARPFRIGRPQPMLRALPDAAKAAQILAEACNAVVPNEAVVTEAERTSGSMTQVPA